MEHQVGDARLVAARQLLGKGLDRLAVHRFLGRGEVDQVDGVRDDRLDL
jgi:hypothetical protein